MQALLWVQTSSTIPSPTAGSLYFFLLKKPSLRINEKVVYQGLGELRHIIKQLCKSVGFTCGSAGKESTCNVGDLGSISGLGSSSGEGKGHPLHSILTWRIPWTV